MPDVNQMLELYRIRLETLGPQAEGEPASRSAERRRVQARIAELLTALAAEIPKPKPRQDVD